MQDASGNVAQAVQRVKVVNQRPIADAGENVQRSSRGDRVNVRLDGRGSSDPEGQKLTYFWRCPGVKLDDPASSRPQGAFPVGVKFATLFVTDAAGARSKDLVRIKVVADAQARGRSASLRRTATEAYELAGEAQSDPTAQLGLQAATTAFVLNDQADAQLRLAYESDEAEESDLTDYFILRGLQAQASNAAAERLLQTFQRTGDDRALKAAVAAFRNSVEATLDLAD